MVRNHYLGGPPRRHLLRILGVGFGVAVGIGDTIGAGILRTPGEVAAQLGTAWLVLAVWLLGGLYALFCTIAVAELGAMLPQAGGWYIYARRAFGEYGGFVVGCGDWMAQSVGMAYLAVALGEFVAGLQPSLEHGVKLVAVISLVVLAVLNWVGLRSGSRVQELTSLAKAVALIGFVVACFSFGGNRANAASSASTLFPSQSRDILLALVVALQAVVVTYDGWYAAIYFAEEDERPGRNLPRAAIGGVVCCIAIFVLLNAALIHILPMPQLAGSRMPSADAAMIIFGGHGREIILIISLITVISNINATLLIAPRIVFAMSRDGLFLRGATFVNVGGTPAIGLLLSALVSTVLILIGNFERLIAMASFLYVAIYVSGFVALFVLRRREPSLQRPFKAWGYPWTTLSVVLGSGAFLAAFLMSDLTDSLLTLIVVALTYPVYVLFIRKKIKE